MKDKKLPNKRFNRLRSVSVAACSMAFCEVLKRLVVRLPLLVRPTPASQPQAVRPPPVECTGTALLITQ